MRHTHFIAGSLLIGGALCAASWSGPGNNSSAPGSELFKHYCASCHGGGGEGDGALAGKLEYAPPDLTLLARHNRGVFPFERVRKVIEGRTPVGRVGSEMPPWGDVLRKAHDGYDAAAVAAQIDAITRHVESLQATDEK